MKKSNIKLALNCPVELVDFEDEVFQGYLVYSKDKGGYLVLPFDYNKDIYFFKASHIKSIKYLWNEVVLK